MKDLKRFMLNLHYPRTLYSVSEVVAVCSFYGEKSSLKSVDNLSFCLNMVISKAPPYKNPFLDFEMLKTLIFSGNITRTRVDIDDEIDKPTLDFVETQYTIEEKDDYIQIPIKRTGMLCH